MKVAMQTLLGHPFRAVLFDMDNTLFDFVGAMQRACIAAVDVLGVGTPEELLGYYLRWKYDVENNANLQDFMIDHNCFSVESYFTAVKAFDEAKNKDLVAYEGIPEVLEKLSDNGYTLGIVTDSYLNEADKRLTKTGLKPYFNLLATCDVTGFKKPHLGVFEYALAELNLRPFEAAYVGDSLRRDIVPAQALGMTSVYAKYGDRNFFESTPALPPAKTLVAEKPSDIIRLLL